MNEENKKWEQIAREMEALQKKLDDVQKQQKQISKIAFLLEKARIGDIIENYNHPRRIFLLNLLVGLSRGLGLTVGTALVLATIGFVLREFISIPIIGKYISDIVEYVKIDQYYR